MLRARIPAVGLSILLAGGAVQAAELPWVARSNENARVLLDVLAKYSPETASQIGVDGYDEAITDLSRDTFAAQNADFARAIADFRQRSASEADPKVRQDLEILIDAAQDNISSNTVNQIGRAHV
jgi:hypothetical protein